MRLALTLARRPTVLGVISSARLGGAERYFCSWARGLSEEGCVVHVVCPDGPMLRLYEAHAASVATMPLDSLLEPGSLGRLAALARALKPDIVHTHLWNADVFGLVAARFGPPRLLVSTIYGPYHLPLGLHGLAAAKRRGLSAVYRGVYRGFDGIIAVSEFVRRDLHVRRGLRVDKARVAVIEPALDASADDGLGERGAPGRPGTPRLVCVANFFPIKGQETLLRALPGLRARYPSLECRFIGDGPTRPALEALAAGLGLGGAAVFLGGVADPRREVARADLLVLPSLCEGLPHAILEAWALGTPVVASRAGGIPEAVRDGDNGRLVEAGDPAALRAALAALLDDPAARARLAEGGRAALSSRFSPELNAGRMLSLYRTLMAREDARP